MKLILFSVTIFSAVICVESARILGVFHMPSYSHHIVGKTILKELAKRGHEVTMISSFPMKPPLKNYEDIFVDELIKFKAESMMKMLLDAEKGSILEKVFIGYRILNKTNEICLSHKSVQNLLSSNRTYDLVMLDWILTDALLGIGHHYKAPVIAVSAVGSSVMSFKVTANPSPYSYVPNLFTTGSDKMSFYERVINTIITIFLELNERFYHEAAQDALLHNFFPSAPPLADLIKNISLVFLNCHLSYESPRPYVPNMIQIGGVHIEEPKELENDLQRFMDDASEGVLYFSLGGNAKSEDLPKEKIQSIIRAFGKLPLKVLWKIEMVNGPKIPANVRMEKWLPQTDVLAHPNMKIFVTHGGLLSTIEAIHRGVPMVGIPCFADQEVNIKNAVNHGYSKMVRPDDLTEDGFYDAVIEVLNNPRYRENIKKRSHWLRDQPIKPLDKAIFWTEYVLRHGGAPHLQTVAVKLPWYQYFLLDVFAFLAGIVVVSFLILRKIIKLLLLLVFKKSQTKANRLSSKSKKSD